MESAQQMTSANELWIERLSGPAETRDAALAELRQLLLGRLRRSFRDRVYLDNDFVEDVVQDALVKVLSHLDTFEGRSQFTTWATTIAIRTAYSELRKKQWKNVSLSQMLADTDRSDDLAVDAQPSAELASDKASLIGTMYEVIEQKLTGKQRDALLAELRGMPLEEIARRTESSRNAVYKLTHDARKRLKRGLEEIGYSSDDWQAMSN